MAQSYFPGQFKQAFLISFLLLSFLWAISCRHPEDPDLRVLLPAVTQEGKNTFGCMLNGKPFVTKDRYATENPTAYFSNRGYGGFWVTGYDVFDLKKITKMFPTYSNQSNQTDDRVGVKVGIYATRDFYPNPGRYTLNSSFRTGFLLLNSYDNCPTVNYAVIVNDSTPIYRNGYMEISKLDTARRIIAGTFEYTLVKSGCDTIKVTDGRFDLHY